MAKTLNNKVGTVFCTDGLHSVTTDRVRSALTKSGLDPDLLRDLAKRFCFARAKTRLSVDGLIDEVAETPERWLFQLSDRYREDNVLTYEKKATFWYDKGTETVGADDPELLEEVNAMFAKYGMTYLPSDVSTLIRRIFAKEKGMLSLRHHGVVYFVPSESNALMDKVTLFLEELGAECITIPISPENKQVINKSISMLVENVQLDLAKITAEMKTLQDSGETMTNRIANNRWKALLGELDRLKIFAKSLSVDSGELLQKVRVQEMDLAFVTSDSMDVIAALAHQGGRMDNALGRLAKAAYQGELPALDSPRVKAFVEQMPEVGSMEIPSIKNVVKITTEVEV